MKRYARKAYTALKKKGIKMVDNGNGWNSHFIISGEDFDANGMPVADYYQEYLKEYVNDDGKIENPFGVRTDVVDTLAANGLYAEWIDAGTLGVYDA